MTTPQLFEPRGLDHQAQRHLIDRARHAGIDQFQVLALVHSQGRLMLVDGVLWTAPIAWVRPPETISDALERLCSQHLCLTGWDASFAATAVCRLPDASEVLQIGFDVTLAADTEPSQPGACHWWHTHTEPPALHPLTRPLAEKLYGIPPRGC